MTLIEDDRTIVVGAGAVGLCVANYLLRMGKRVVVLESSRPAAGASFGNGGLLSVDTNLPIAMPGILKNVPRWLMDPMGPVTIDPKYVFNIAPWLVKWIRASRMPEVKKAVAALRALHKDGYDRYRELLGEAAFIDLIKISGVMQFWETDQVSTSDKLADSLREADGIQTKYFSAQQLLELFPGLSPTVRRGLLLPRNGYTVSPDRLVATLAENFSKAGGYIKTETVMKVIPQENCVQLITNVANHCAATVVIAAGAFSGKLLKPLGARLPLQTERGYHLDLANCSLKIPMPVMHRGRGFGFTPMEGGMRLSGTVELADIETPPNEKRAIVLGEHAKSLFPSITWENETIWMGNRPSFPDSIPAIGPLAATSPRLFVAFGHGHYGMVGAPATGRLLAEIICGRQPHIDPSPYAPGRFSRAVVQKDATGARL